MEKQLVYRSIQTINQSMLISLQTALNNVMQKETDKETSNEISKQTIDSVWHGIFTTAYVLEQLVDVVAFKWIEAGRYVVADKHINSSTSLCSAPYIR